jgi:hypothetical protein
MCGMKSIASVAPLLLVLGGLVLFGCDDKRQRAARAAADFARPASLDGLIRRALLAVTENNPAAYVKLVATVSETRRACPDRFKGRDLAKLRKRWQRTLEKVKTSLSQCADMVNFKKARKVSVSGGQRDRTIAKCKEEVVRLKDIHVIYELNKVRFEVVLARPYVRQGAIYGLARAPTCRILKKSSK